MHRCSSDHFAALALVASLGSAFSFGRVLSPVSDRVPSAEMASLFAEISKAKQTTDSIPAASHPAIDRAGARGLAGADEGWFETASRALAAEEYRASLSAAGLQAPNRAQDFRTYFGDAGITHDTGVPGPNGSAVRISQHPGALDPGTLYCWRLRIATDSPFFPRSPWLTLPYNAASEADLRTASGTTDVASAAGDASGLRFVRIDSNPVVEATRLHFITKAAGRVRMTVHDVTGRRVSTVFDCEVPAGVHEARWEARDDRGHRLASGVYLVRLEQNGRTAVTDLIVAR